MERALLPRKGSRKSDHHKALIAHEEAQQALSEEQDEEVEEYEKPLKSQEK